MKNFALIACVMAVAAASAEKQPYERYQSIVDRQMFGQLPKDFDPTKSPNEVQRSSVTEKELTKEQEKLQSSIHFSVINVTPDGATVVGFTDNSDPKMPMHYYLKVGEKRNGWEVKAADAAAATMTIVKDDIEVSLSLGGNSAKGGGTTARAGAAAAAGAETVQGARKSFLNGGSLRSRRMMRRQESMAAEAEQAKAAEAAAAREAERQAQAEQEKAQREADRAEQRQQLLAIQEELKRVRAEKEAKKTEEEKGGAENDAQ